MTGNERYTIILSDGTLIAFVPFSRDENSQPYWGTEQKFYIDLNGPKKPNIIGKDVFLFMIYNDKVIAFGSYNSENFINSSCIKTGNGQMCAAKIIKDGWEIKDDYPW